MAMTRAVGCAVLLAALPGCFRMSLRTGAPRAGEPVEQVGTSLVYGLVPANVAVGECPYGLSRVDVYWPWWGPLVYWASFGIVAPLRTEYVCAEGTGVLPQGVPPSNPPL